MGLAGPSEVYIHLKKGNWNKDPIRNADIDVRKAFIAAKDQFNAYAKETGGSVPFDREKMEKELLALMDNQESLTYQPGINFIQSVESMMSKSGGLHMEELSGLGMNFNSLAYGYGKAEKRPQLESKLKKLLVESKDLPGLIASLETIADKLKNMGKDLIKRESDGKLKVFPKVYITDPAEDEKILKLYSELREVINRLNGIQSNGLEGKDLNTEVKEISSLLVKQGFKFSNNMSGALGETLVAAKSAGQIVAAKNMRQLAQKMGLDYVDAEVIQRGGETYNSSGVETIRAKGDVEIKLSWKLGEESGKWSYLTSVKAHSMKGQSRESQRYNKSGDEVWRGRLVSGARYEVIFNEAGKTIETIFCNMYVHERVKLESGNNPVLGYIGARCAANILAGLPGEYMAHAFQTATGKPIPIHELLNIMSQQSNLDTMSKYINLWFNDTDENKVKEENKRKTNQTAIERSAKVYNAIKEGVKFSATLGSVSGLSGIV